MRPGPHQRLEQHELLARKRDRRLRARRLAGRRVEAQITYLEHGRFEDCDRFCFAVATEMCSPTLMPPGTDELKKRGDLTVLLPLSR
jgi:hypothetical protein